MAGKVKPPKELVEEWRREDEEARRIRMEKADWNFIEKQPEPLKTALKYFIEAGDRYVAAKLAGLTLDEFDKLRRKAGIPSIT